jgi:Galactose-3-O-sulfotransferase
MSHTRTEPQDPTVIFLHIGKTGGSTLQRILYRHFRPSDRVLVKTRPQIPGRPAREETLRAFASRPPQERARPRLIEGHLIYGIHELVPRPSTYITLLRDPIALSISQYRYVCRTPTHPLHEEALRLGSLDAYVRSGLSLETDNSQTRAISGDTTAPFGGCSDQMLARSKAHLGTSFSVVGITESFDASLALLQRAFGWSKLWYSPVNGAPVSAAPAPASTLRFLEEQNRFDLELHAWAAGRLRETVASDPAVQERIRRIRSRNALYRPWARVTYHYPRRVRDAVMTRTPEGIPRDA